VARHAFDNPIVSPPGPISFYNRQGFGVFSPPRDVWSPVEPFAWEKRDGSDLVM